MALAVKTSPETTTRTPHQQLVISSFLGALYILFSFALVFVGLPMLWRMLDLAAYNEFLADSLLVLVTLPIIVGLFWLGKKLEGPHPTPGARAGACIGAFLVLLILLTTVGIGNGWFARNRWEPQMDTTLGIILTSLVGGGLLFLLVWMYLKPGFGRWLVGVEESGWFHATSFKPNQGLRVRRGTLIGLLAIGICGIYVLISHRTLSSGAWDLVVPFSASAERLPGGAVNWTWLSVPIMFKVNMTLPVLLMVGVAWFSWRVVNWPKFADFLIATEAEMNKVSWTTRKRLVQDTIVVLVTVFLMTIFLFVVDVLWIRILSSPVVDVLKIDPQEALERQRTPTTW
ncbi:MAG: preprotein translocase subunit SecE [Gemmataceae bacterium]|nr:preprotein translocase subunit SecE [Gemmataceae bacterium]